MYRQGSTAVTVAISLTVLLGFAAISIDIGLARHNRQLLSNAAEAAAHGGSAKLDGTAAGVEDARATALALAAEHIVDGTPLTLDSNDANAADGDVVLGYWDGDEVVPSDDPPLITAVQVIARRDTLPSFFAEVVFGQQYLSAGDYAIAQAGGASDAECVLPLALADCELASMQAGGCNADIILNSARVDNGAWGRLGTSQPNASFIRGVLRDGTCASGGSTDESLTLNNGQISSALTMLGTAISASPDTWKSAEWGAQPTQLANSSVTAYGHVLYGQIPIFDDPGNCVSTGYNGTHPIVGYATAVVYDVVSTSSGKTIKMRIACDEMPDADGGGAYFGTTVPPRFLR